MSVVCIACMKVSRGNRRNKDMGGSSRVVETRKRILCTDFKGKRVYTRTVERLRECRSCKRRWRTKEIFIPGSMKGFGAVEPPKIRKLDHARRDLQSRSGQ